MYPAWAILEYANSRLMLVREMAIRLPRIIVNAEMPQSTPVISVAMEGNAVVKTRSSAANPAIFAPAAMKAVTAVGEPWYTSGVHIWKGTAAILKPSPTRMRAAPMVRSRGEGPFEARKVTIPFRDVVPVA